MKWYSVKKYQPPDAMNLIVRVWHFEQWDTYLNAKYFADGSEWEFGVFIEDKASDEVIVTHFCIPDAVEIEEC